MFQKEVERKKEILSPDNMVFAPAPLLCFPKANRRPALRCEDVMHQKDVNGNIPWTTCMEVQYLLRFVRPVLAYYKFRQNKRAHSDYRVVQRVEKTSRNFWKPLLSILLHCIRLLFRRVTAFQSQKVLLLSYQNTKRERRKNKAESYVARWTTRNIGLVDDMWLRLQSDAK